MSEAREIDLKDEVNDKKRARVWNFMIALLCGGVGLVLVLVLLVVLSAFNITLPVWPPLLMMWVGGVGFGIPATVSGLLNISEKNIANTLLWGGGFAAIGAVIGSIVGFFVFTPLGAVLGATIGAFIGGSLGASAALVIGLCYDSIYPNDVQEQAQEELIDINNQMALLNPRHEKHEDNLEEEEVSCWDFLFHHSHPSHEPHADSVSDFIFRSS